MDSGIFLSGCYLGSAQRVFNSLADARANFKLPGRKRKRR